MHLILNILGLPFKNIFVHFKAKILNASVEEKQNKTDKQHYIYFLDVNIFGRPPPAIWTIVEIITV